MQIDAVIFDMDGTLTEPLLDFSEIRSQIGLDPDCPSILQALEDFDPPARRNAMKILCRHEKQAAAGSTLQPGAEQMLSELHRRSIKTGILTRNSRKSAVYVLEKHGLIFDGIITREDGPVKPDGYGVLELCRQFEASATNTLVVGDYVHDLLAARHAGAIAILSMSHPRTREYQSYADFCIRNLDELCQIIDNLQNER